MDLPKCRCIYEIKNKKNGKVYIGSTKNFRKRVYLKHLKKTPCESLV